MSNIKILPQEVYNKIAAGEVVDRPASVIKELVENSIDAGATQIEIEITQGGIERIGVRDNGCGIAADDVKTAFMPHATSKISSPDDLYALKTLGFRGEALASIAAVSDVILITTTEFAANGVKYSIKGGIQEYFEEGSYPKGTSITVANLFYNVPARKKFLKSVKAEQNEITNLVSRLILSNPRIVIKYYADGQNVLQSAGQGLDSAIYAVYGIETLKQLIPVTKERGPVSVSGYIGKPDFSKPNRTYQTIIINGRYVTNSIVSAIIFNAYDGHLMKRQYPFYVLNIEIDKELVDVNVHPNKMEVRFSDSSLISSAVASAVSGALYADKRAVTYTAEKETANEAAAIIEGSAASPNETQAKIPPKNLNFYSYFSDTPKKGVLRESNSMLDKVLSRAAETDFAARNQGGPSQETQETDAPAAEQQTFSAIRQARVVGTLFNTYIIIEHQDNFYIIDQHAAHERILYDEYIRQVDNGNLHIQPLLVPYTFSVNASENSFIAEKLTEFAKFGFEIEPFGAYDYRINAIPGSLSNINLADFVDNILRDLQFLRIKDSFLLKDKLAVKACKAAIKGGDTLSKSEIDILIKLIYKNEIELRCPHGRPVILRFEKGEIEKWFKRKL